MVEGAIERLRRLLLDRSVRRGDFVLASGQRSSYYIDCRLTTMSAELLSAAAKREAPQLDEKLYLEVFAPPKRAAPAAPRPQRHR